ncbi:glycosyltransferase family 1 protein [Agromyces aurantiacus]|uniref:Glycosyltransferase family 1 protein n=1 Tax=Agromyces aurantiacus TaxID=165814 RepID=A0ABV9RAV8_9MICO|nr:hypothetical protein [Agromyces aurantiacus]
MLLRLRAYELLYRTDPVVRAARRALRGVRPDRILANDIESLPIALDLAPGRSVHGDLHEYYPGLHDDNPRWVRLRKPYLEWLVRRYAPRAASLTTVGAEVAEAYRSFGLHVGVVTNSPAFVPMEPSPVATPIRIIHPGASLRSRRLEQMMQAVAESSADVSLTMYLAGNDPAYVRELRTLAASLGNRVRVEDAVPHDDLLPLINAHDVGIHVLPPTVTNNALALPNKFFDYVQARVGVIVGPTPAMASLVREHGFGAVAAGFEKDDIRAVVDTLTPNTVAAWKQAASGAARALSAETQLPVWAEAVDALVGAGADQA